MNSLLERLNQLHQDERHQEIVELIEKLPAKERDFDVQNLYARALNNLDREADALAVLESIREQGERDALWNFRMGYSLYYLHHLNREKEAAEYLRKAIALGDGHPDTVTLLRMAESVTMTGAGGDDDCCADDGYIPEPPMTKDRFWALIDGARAKAGGWEEMSGPLVSRLARYDTPDIMLWHQIFLLYHQLSCKNKLWAAAYVINGGCSDDGFDYFRGWLIAQGRDVFLKALADPDSLAYAGACQDCAEFEDILSAAASAYFEKQGGGRDYSRFYGELNKYRLTEQEEKAITDEIVYDRGIDADWDEDEKAMRVLLPKLCAAFEWY